MSQTFESVEPVAGDGEVAIPVRLAPGTDLLGQYDSTAFNQPQYLLRRHDGQTLQVSRLLYTVAAAIDGERDAHAVASLVSAELGRPVSADNVAYLVRQKLAPLGIIAGDALAASLTRANPLLGLRFRARVVPERIHRAATWLFRPLFWAPVVVAVLLGVASTNVWLLTSKGAAVVAGSRQMVLHPTLLLVLTGLTIAVGAFHEIGHATAARYGGARPGVMGVGIYLMMPAFYTDVTDSYRLDRRGRLRTDLGGVYFNAVAILAAVAVFQATQFRLLLLFIVLSEMEVLYQFLPFVRMDGYYVVADLIGVPNLFAYLGPVVASLMRRQSPTKARLAALTSRARTAISIWVALTIPILAINLVVFGIIAPHLFPTMWRSAQVLEHAIAHEAGAGDVVGVLNHATQLVLLLIPAAGIVLLVAMIGRRLARAVLGRLASALSPAAPQRGRARRRIAWAAMGTLGLSLATVLAAAVSLGRGTAPHAGSAAAAPLTGGGALPSGVRPIPSLERSAPRRGALGGATSPAPRHDGSTITRSAGSRPNSPPPSAGGSAGDAGAPSPMSTQGGSPGGAGGVPVVQTRSPSAPGNPAIVPQLAATASAAAAPTAGTSAVPHTPPTPALAATQLGPAGAPPAGPLPVAKALPGVPAIPAAKPLPPAAPALPAPALPVPALPAAPLPVAPAIALSPARAVALSPAPAVALAPSVAVPAVSINAVAALPVPAGLTPVMAAAALPATPALPAPSGAPRITAALPLAAAILLVGTDLVTHTADHGLRSETDSHLTPRPGGPTPVAGPVSGPPPAAASGSTQPAGAHGTAPSAPTVHGRYPVSGASAPELRGTGGPVSGASAPELRGTGGPMGSIAGGSP